LLTDYNTWKYPDIPGIMDFKGKLMHSAARDESYDLTGKTVAIIGGGSSAVQVIPSIQPRVKKLIPYLRSPVWITAGFGAKYAGGVNFECKYKNIVHHLAIINWNIWLKRTHRHGRSKGVIQE